MKEIGMEGLTHGRGGRELYARDWMTERSTIPEGRIIDSKFMYGTDSPYIGVRGLGGFDGLGITVHPVANADQAVDEPGLLDFSRYWGQVKNTFTDLDNTGYKITLKIQQLGQIYSSLERQGRTDLMQAMQPDIDKVNEDLQTWWTCKGYVDQYKSVWNSAANTMGLNGLGFVMIPWLTYAVLAGIVFVAMYGLNLISTYKFQTNVLDAVAAKTISAEAGATLMAEANKTTAGGVLGNVGVGLGNGVMLAGAGVLAYFLWSAYRTA